MRKLGVLGVLAVLGAAPIMAYTTAVGCVRFDHMAVGDGSVADVAIASNSVFSETYLYVRGDESDTPLRIVEAGNGRALSISSGYRIVVDFPPGVVRVAIEGWTNDSLTMAINDEERRASRFHTIPLFKHVLMSYQDGRPAWLTFAPRESHGKLAGEGEDADGAGHGVGAAELVRVRTADDADGQRGRVAAGVRFPGRGHRRADRDPRLHRRREGAAGVSGRLPERDGVYTMYSAARPSSARAMRTSAWSRCWRGSRTLRAAT